MIMGPSAMFARNSFVAFLAGLSLASTSTSLVFAEDRPNVLVILADDLGYSDLGAFGGEIATSNLDRLAAQGLRFSHFTNSGRCSPSRAALLTGLYPHQCGMGWLTAADLGQPEYRGELSPDSATLAETLSGSGYRTYLSGKWHLTHRDHQGIESSQDSWPLQRGFDRFYGVLRGGSYHAPDTLVEDNEHLSTPRNEAFHLTDALSQKANTFIEDHVRQHPKTPFFAYLAFTAPHWPLHAPEDDIAPYRDVYARGWDVLRDERFHRLRSLGLIDHELTLPLRSESVPAWDSLDLPQQADLAERMAIYAAQVTQMDRGIGSLIETLESVDQLNDTLILFLADNGASDMGGPFGFNRRPNQPPGSPKSFANYGEGWAQLSNTPFRSYKRSCRLRLPRLRPAQLSNTPFRSYKGSVYEGGIATPCIAHWPRKIVEHGRIRTEVAHLVDVFPTCLEISGVPHSGNPKGRPSSRLSGRSLVPVLKGMSGSERTLFWEHEGHRAAQRGPWKAVSPHEAPWELYDLENDRGESHNLAGELPAIVRDLSSAWDTHAERNPVLPLDGRPWKERIASTVSVTTTEVLETPDPPVDHGTEKPNIVLILCDDLGYGDLGCYGSTQHPTPRIDRMAEEGVVLTSFYSTSGFCTPSRASLLTGCYAQRIGMHMNYLPPGTSTMRQVLFPAAWKGLHPDEITVAEALKPLGYATACIGKWHLGDQKEFLPTRQGFDSYFGIPYSNDMGARQFPFNPPLPLLRNEVVIEAPVEQETLTKRYTEEAIEFIRQRQETPFFLYLPHTMPHNPVHVSEDFKDQTGQGLYADCVAELDASTGRILDTIDSLGLAEKTLIIFTSDNGAARAWGSGNAPLSGFKGTTSEGGMRVPFIARWKNRFPAGHRTDEMASTLDLLPTVLGMAGGSPPENRVLDGHDIFPLLSETSGITSPSEAFYYYQQDQLQAVRKGKWKLYLPLAAVRQPLSLIVASQNRAPRLYDLETDMAEKNDLADAHPEIVGELTAHAEKAREELGDLNHPGKGQRPAGMAKRPVPLTKTP